MYDRINGDAPLFARTIAFLPGIYWRKGECPHLKSGSERRIARLSENNAHQPVILSAAAQHQELTVDRIGQYNPGPCACNPAVVQINAAGFDCAPGFSLGRDNLAHGEQIGCGQPFSL